MQPSGLELTIAGWPGCAPQGVWLRSLTWAFGPGVVGLPRKELTPLQFGWIEVGLVLVTKPPFSSSWDAPAIARGGREMS